MSHTSRRIVLLILAAGAFSALPLKIARAPEPTTMCGRERSPLSRACGQTIGVRLTTAAAAPLARASKPVELGADPVEVTLAPQQGALAAHFGQSPERKLSLVLYGLNANRQPGVTYNVYLGLVRGAKPGADDPRFVGSFNFFSVLGGAPAAKRDAALPAFSFDVTDLVRTHSARQRLDDGITVTIVPSNAPQKGARASIATIALEAE